MAQIRVLDQHTAELIAAGEVVERPSSVVKELMENAIDAGAAHITVEIERGGISMIRIADDGTGIEAECIPTAFLRHATSKIASQEDLEHIGTLGFRGEALASIASVARVELVTKTQADEYAYCYRISGGREEGLEPAARPVGTTFTVRDLFFNTPARMKFLKKDQSEGNYVADVASQLALSHPEIAVKFIRDGKVQFQTPGDGKLLSASYAVLSREFSRDLTPVDSVSGNYRVQGLVTPPKSCRASRSMQHFFINGRFVKNRTMMAALEAAYKGTLMQGKFPGCVLTLSMPAQLVDVNVHPAKTEVRFAREKEVFDAVYAAVKAVLFTPENTYREFSFEKESAQADPKADKPTPLETPEAAPVPRHGQGVQTPLRDAERPASKPQQIRAYNDFVQSFAQREAEMAASRPAAYQVSRRTPDVFVDDERELPSAADETAKSVNAVLPMRPEKNAFVVTDAKVDPKETVRPEAPAAQAPCLPEPNAADSAAQPVGQISLEAEDGGEALRFVGEVFDTYIVAQRGTEMCLIDKHAAHERVIFEELRKSYGNVSSQMLLCPAAVQLSAEEKEALLEAAQLLTKSGLEVEDFGGKSVVVRAVPADVVPGDVEDLVLDVAQRLLANPRETVSEKTEWVLHSIACRAAIKAGDKNHPAHLMKLAQDVLDGRIPPFCPHGRPVVLKITLKELEKQFGRQG